jgi:biotin transport system substrate-specific component
VENSISSRISIKNMVMIAMFAAFLAVMSQISLPMPTGVPITIQVFAVTLIGVVLGWKMGALAVLVYILIGAVGVPVFANFQGGLHVIAGTAGGYIIAWPVMTALCGIRPKTGNEKLNFALSIVLSLAGLMICECVGALQWDLLTNGNLKAIMIYSLTAFIPKDIILTVLGVVIGRKVRTLIARTGAF